MNRQEALEEAWRQMKVLDDHREAKRYPEYFILEMLSNVVFNLRKVID